MDLDKYKGLTNEQLALICATEIEAAYRHNRDKWNYTKDIARDAQIYYKFLNNPENEIEEE